MRRELEMHAAYRAPFRRPRRAVLDKIRLQPPIGELLAAERPSKEATCIACRNGFYDPCTVECRLSKMHLGLAP